MKEFSLFALADKAGLSRAELAEAVIAYVQREVGPEAAEQLRHMLPPPPPPRTQKRLTVQGSPKSAKPSVSVVFTSPKKDPDKTSR